MDHPPPNKLEGAAARVEINAGQVVLVLDGKPVLELTAPKLTAAIGGVDKAELTWTGRFWKQRVLSW
jgi:hypothetical protein